MSQKAEEAARVEVSKPVSKQEAVRLALEELGRDGKTSEIQLYIKKTFGIDMTTNHISAAKGAILKKAANKFAGKDPERTKPAKVAPIKPEERKGEMSNKHADGPEAKQQVSKKDAIRQSLERLGNSAMPTAIKQDVMAHFGLDLTTGYISTTKGEILKSAAKKAPTPAPVEEVAPPPQKDVAPAEVVTLKPSVALEDVLAFKGLVDRIGTDNLRLLLDAFSR